MGAAAAAGGGAVTGAVVVAAGAGVASSIGSDPVDAVGGTGGAPGGAAGAWARAGTAKTTSKPNHCQPSQRTMVISLRVSRHPALGVRKEQTRRTRELRRAKGVR